MLDDRCQGPFTLDALAAAGVRPGTYVWCKDMADWQQAREVADICRYFRQRLAGVHLPAAVSLPEETEADRSHREALQQLPPAMRNIVEKSGTRAGVPLDTSPDIAARPSVPLVSAIMAALLCFPPTGAVAVYLCMASRRVWNAAVAADGSAEADGLRRQAHDLCRSARMWTGITISAGFILWAFLFRFFL